MNQMPKHIAIILDGNGRWAKKRLMPRTYGHYYGAQNISKIATYADQLGISYLTVFCFSTENWNRPKEEVEFLMSLPVKYLKEKEKSILDSNIRVQTIGRKDRIPENVCNALERIEDLTKHHTGLVLTLAIDYGALNDVQTAIKKIINSHIKEEDISEETIFSYLSTSNLPKVDLCIRTSGEERISNFLMLEIAYSELYFCKTNWPDFDEKELDLALEEYKNRNRRFGRIEE